MNLVEKRKIFWSVLDPVLLTRGYKAFKTGGDPTYLLVKEETIISITFNFPRNENIDGGNLSLTHNYIEDIIVEIGSPSRKLKEYHRKKRYVLKTTIDLSSKFRFGVALVTEEAVICHAQAFLHYLDSHGAEFVEKYSYLPNILKEMDRLRMDGKYWLDILSGGPEHLMRGIIISKLCNDPEYNNKIEWLEEVFVTMDLDEWIPYWEKLKSILPSIEPKYPYYK